MASAQATTATAANLGTDLKPAAASSASSENKPKPCCVCKDEKAARDECMLFSNSDNAQQECKDLISKYKSCMAGYGFSLP